MGRSAAIILVVVDGLRASMGDGITRVVSARIGAVLSRVDSLDDILRIVAVVGLYRCCVG